MKRAAIIITPSDRIKWTTYTADGWEDDIDLWCSTSEQLLADLRLIATTDLTDDDELAKAKALVRVHLPKEDS